MKGRCPRPLGDGAVTTQSICGKFRYPEDSWKGPESRVLSIKYAQSGTSPEESAGSHGSETEGTLFIVVIALSDSSPLIAS